MSQIAAHDLDDADSDESRLLISFDRGFILRINAERDAFRSATGQKLARTAMIRILLKEALDARARSRNEQVPAAIAMGHAL